MKRLIFIGIVLLGAGAALYYLRPQPVDNRPQYEAVTVAHGDVVWRLRETAYLHPKEPVLVEAKFEGQVKWMVEEGKWVEKGDTVFVLSDEEVLQKVSSLRSDMLTLQQELDLAELRRQHEGSLQAQKLKSAQRGLELQQLAYRILTAKPEGNGKLIRLHEQLGPLEKETARIRRRFEIAQDEYQVAQDGYLLRLDEWQTGRDELLKVQTRIDELLIIKDQPVEKLSLDEQKERAKEMAELEQKQEELAGHKKKIPKLARAMKTEQRKVEKLRGPRDKLAAQLAEREAKEKELYIQLEIEKLGQPLELLLLDKKAAVLRRDEAARKLKQGEIAFKGGSLSKAKFDRLRDDVEDRESELRVIEEKIKIERRPPRPEVLTEAQRKLKEAEQKAASAKDVHDRALAIRDHDVVVLRERMKQTQLNIDSTVSNLPSVIESHIRFIKRELDLLDEDEAARRDELKAQITELNKELKQATKTPPNIHRAPVSGVVRLKYYGWGRKIQAGDRARQDDPIVMIFPPTNMEVALRVNEVNLQQVRKGMKATVTLPALSDRQFEGGVSQISAIGKDKFSFGVTSRWEQPGFADVTQFEVRIALEEVDPDFRQGMTAIVDLVVAEEKGVLHVPLGAVQEKDGTFHVLQGRPGLLTAVEVKGRTFGNDTFIITDGLAQGAEVWIEKAGTF